MNVERLKQLKHGLEDQVEQIDALPADECPQYLLHERELMVQEIRDIEQRLKAARSPMSRPDVNTQTFVRLSSEEAA